MGLITGNQSPAWREQERAYYAGEIDDDRVRCSDCHHYGTKTWNEKVRSGFTDTPDVEFKEHSTIICRKGHGSHPDILRRCFAYTPKQDVQKNIDALRSAVG